MKTTTLVMALLITFTAVAQRTAEAIAYQGGKQQFIKSVFSFLGSNNGLYTDPARADSVRSSNKYFSILFKVEKDGTVHDLAISSYNDTTNIPVVEKAVRQTSGRWLNNSGSAQWVVLPLYFVTYGEDASVKLPLVKSALYNAQSKKSDLVYLDDLIIKMGPTVH